MKLKIYILPDEPSLADIERQIANLKPPINTATGQQLLIQASTIRERVRSVALSGNKTSFHQSQTLSDGTHTVSLTGRLDPPSLLRRLMDFL